MDTEKVHVLVVTHPSAGMLPGIVSCICFYDLQTSTVGRATTNPADQSCGTLSRGGRDQDLRAGHSHVSAPAALCASRCFCTFGTVPYSVRMHDACG